MRKNNKLAARPILNQVLALVKAERFVDARKLAEQICDEDKQNVDALFILGAINGRLGDHYSAIKCNRRVLKISPKHVQAMFNLAIGLRDTGQLTEAVRAFRKTLKLDPHHPNAWASLGHALINLGRYDEAENSFRKALKEQPDDPDFYASLGSAMQSMGRYEAAVRSYRKALQLNHPDAAEVYNNLGNAFCFQGRLNESLEAYHKALKLKPGDPRFYSNLLLTLHYLPDISNKDLLEEHRLWPGNKIKPLPDSHADSPDSDSDRRLRLGYVSSDLRSHSVAYFIEPILSAHNRDAFEVYCFFSGENADATSTRLRLLSDKWFDIEKLSDKDCANLIRSNEVDILIDLNGHTSRNRLPLFARKPAPIQITYLGYPDTTGVSAIDFRITDWISDPTGYEEFYTESLIRLEGSFLCYRPPDNAPSVTSLPAANNDFITFGSFNNLAKINEEVVQLWSRLLHEAPETHLLIKNHSLTDESTRSRYTELFKKYGIPRERLTMVGFVQSAKGHLDEYARVDIALDSFPYNGTTTTCESLWMGVPVVSLSGTSHRARVGLSLLSALGKKEWVAEDEDSYINIAVDLASDLNALARTRKDLRSDMKGSMLCDSRIFTSGLESAFRQIWVRHSIEYK